jgi:hypothetical protein
MYESLNLYIFLYNACQHDTIIVKYIFNKNNLLF